MEAATNSQKRGRQINSGISFVLPFTFHECIGTSGDEWRQNYNGYAEQRLRMMLATFLHNFSQNDLDAFVIISPESDLVATRAIVRSLTSDSRYTVISERCVCPDLPWGDAGGRAADGWMMQQMLKLGAARLMASSFYVTLDCDIVCVRAFSKASLLCGDRAIVGIETESDYSRIYIDSFALEEANIKHGRYDQSASLLEYRRIKSRMGIYYSETPCVLHTGSVINLLEFLNSRSGRSWSRVLADARGWTEYGLYFQFLEKVHMIEELCLSRGCNAVLDLERSVWHVSSRYRRERQYDWRHFCESADALKHGPFVAIQSWLPIDQWLPEKFCSVVEFYDQMKNWLFVYQDEEVRRKLSGCDIQAIDTTDLGDTTVCNVR